MDIELRDLKRGDLLTSKGWDGTEALTDAMIASDTRVCFTYELNGREVRYIGSAAEKITIERS